MLYADITNSTNNKHKTCMIFNTLFRSNIPSLEYMEDEKVLSNLYGFCWNFITIAILLLNKIIILDYIIAVMAIDYDTIVL